MRPKAMFVGRGPHMPFSAGMGVGDVYGDVAEATYCPNPQQASDYFRKNLPDAVFVTNDALDMYPTLISDMRRLAKKPPVFVVLTASSPRDADIDITQYEADELLKAGIGEIRERLEELAKRK